MMKRQRQRHRGDKTPQSWGFTFVGGGSDRPEMRQDGSPEDSVFALSHASIGDRLWVVDLPAGLEPKGLRLGDEVSILSCTESGSVVLSVNGQQLGFCGDRTQAIYVSRQSQPRTQLRQLKAGSAGRILGYDCPHRGYRKRLLAMGLTPGTEFTVTRHAPLGDPVEISVRGFSLSLRKHEASALLVEVVEE
ncbi:MAG: ferrous iron transport protein A [Phormidium sp. GEM2.Bin31]|nr:MAG: ferrous iron transport protein A [Phormidium sp. GEM2.Bin31]